MNETQTTDPEAPFGRKADGTPRKRAAWQDDPKKVAAAVAKRKKNAAAKKKAAKSPPAIGAALAEPATMNGDDLLGRIRAELTAELDLAETNLTTAQARRDRIAAALAAVSA